MILHTTTYIAPINFDTQDEFNAFVFQGFESLVQKVLTKLDEMIVANKLLYVSPILKSGGNQLVVTRLWIDQAAKDEYDVFRRKAGDVVSLEAAMKNKNVITRETTEEV